MHEATEITISGNLGNYIENSKETSIYNNKSKEKNFSGNIVLFINNPFQYRKRFKKSSCCESSIINYEETKICRKCGYIEEST